jgi:hypothetical protein
MNNLSLTNERRIRMSTKREELAAFNKLNKAFPGKSASLTKQYCSWVDKNPRYYCTVSEITSTCGTDTYTAKEAVDLMIKLAKEVKDDN